MQVVKDLLGMEVSGVSENTVTEIKFSADQEFTRDFPGHDSLE
jgi:hypothetical protein